MEMPFESQRNSPTVCRRRVERSAALPWCQVAALTSTSSRCSTFWPGPSSLSPFSSLSLPYLRIRDNRHFSRSHFDMSFSFARVFCWVLVDSYHASVSFFYAIVAIFHLSSLGLIMISCRCPHFVKCQSVPALCSLFIVMLSDLPRLRSDSWEVAHCIPFLCFLFLYDLMSITGRDLIQWMYTSNDVILAISSYFIDWTRIILRWRWITVSYFRCRYVTFRVTQIISSLQLLNLELVTYTFFSLVVLALFHQ